MVVISGKATAPLQHIGSRNVEPTDHFKPKADWPSFYDQIGFKLQWIGYRGTEIISSLLTLSKRNKSSPSMSYKQSPRNGPFIGPSMHLEPICVAEPVKARVLCMRDSSVCFLCLTSEHRMLHSECTYAEMSELPKGGYLRLHSKES